MESARDRYTREMVEGEDLWMLPQVDTYGYECGGCGIPVFPVSYEQSNLQRPHFRKQKKTPHKDGCNIDGDEKTIARGKKGSVRNELETSPDLSPSRLVLIDERPVVDPDRKPSSEQTSTVRDTKRSEDEEIARPKGRRAANSIRPICRAFIRFPFDRTMSLDVPGVDDKTYLQAFKKLGGKGVDLFSRVRVFYAELAWARPQEEGDFLVIPLSAGEWCDEKRWIKQYRVRVDRSKWSKHKRTKVSNELEVARLEGIDAKKTDSKLRPYVFFVAEQDSAEPEFFNISDHRLICAVVGTISYPDFKSGK
ncbi:hypothetical protein [Pseudomonas chlororaphis]|uniref:hypothetical protein n=1 Tax=Pseudomonas chlororaphis TaxID=587753 RepID=UPI0019274406|nr:hypothetical protein [Pseudomonas chlororaphis]QQX59714.1 hypothetical protein JHW28_03970 [Pseudomonas chlororaphis subsp. aurantiaca]